jgi:hypothetical protein
MWTKSCRRHYHYGRFLPHETRTRKGRVWELEYRSEGQSVKSSAEVGRPPQVQALVWPFQVRAVVGPFDARAALLKRQKASVLEAVVEGAVA